MSFERRLPGASSFWRPVFVFLLGSRLVRQKREVLPTWFLRPLHASALTQAGHSSERDCRFKQVVPNLNGPHNTDPTFGTCLKDAHVEVSNAPQRRGFSFSQLFRPPPSFNLDPSPLLFPGMCVCEQHCRQGPLVIAECPGLDDIHGRNLRCKNLYHE